MLARCTFLLPKPLERLVDLISFFDLEWVSIWGMDWFDLVIHQNIHLWLLHQVGHCQAWKNYHWILLHLTHCPLLLALEPLLIIFIILVFVIWSELLDGVLIQNFVIVDQICGIALNKSCFLFQYLGQFLAITDGFLRFGWQSRSLLQVNIDRIFNHISLIKGYSLITITIRVSICLWIFQFELKLWLIGRYWVRLSSKRALLWCIDPILFHFLSYYFLTLMHLTLP